jgi:hypothetical protein
VSVEGSNQMKPAGKQPPIGYVLKALDTALSAYTDDALRLRAETTHSGCARNGGGRRRLRWDGP